MEALDHRDRDEVTEPPSHIGVPAQYRIEVIAPANARRPSAPNVGAALVREGGTELRARERRRHEEARTAPRAR